ncbi:MAG: hypothetical protein ACRD19_00575 [Terriglobia bacterium]
MENKLSENKFFNRLLVYAFLVGVAATLFALAWYVPGSGLIKALRPFVGLQLIVYSVELYFGVVLVLVAYIFRRQISAVVICLGVSIFAITNGVEGIVTIATSVPFQHEFNWAYFVLYAMGAAGFLAAVAAALSTVRSRRHNAA